MLTGKTIIRWAPTHKHGALTRATEGSSGFDLHAAINGAIFVAHGSYVAIPTGVRLDLPHGIEAQVRGRSGLAFHHGIYLAHWGTVDSDYRGDIRVLLYRGGRSNGHANTHEYCIRPGDRIAQLVFASVLPAHLIEADIIDADRTARGEGGFGSTGR